MTISTGIANAVEHATAKHFVNAPNHAHQLAIQLVGECEALARNTQDDPALLALDYLSRLPTIATLVLKIEKWCTAVNESTPDQIQENGAQ